MDPRLAEEIKRRNKLKLQQWEDKLKIVGKFDKSDTSGEEKPQEPVQQKPQMPFNELDSELTSMFDTMQGMQTAQNNQETSKPEVNQPVSANTVTAQNTSQSAVQQTHEMKVQTQPVSQEDEALAKFDIGPFNIAASNDTLTMPKTESAPTVSAQTAQPTTTVSQTTTSSQVQQSSTSVQPAVTASVTTPPVTTQVVEDENAKYLHIDIVEGKIKLARKNMSIEEAVSLLAKVYNSYKSKM